MQNSSILPQDIGFISGSQNSASSQTENNADIEVNKKLDIWISDSFQVIQKWLETSFLGEYLNPLSISLILIPFLLVFTYIISFLFRIIFLRYLLNHLKKSAKGDKDKRNIDKIPGIIFPLFIALGVRLTLVPLESFGDVNLFFLKNPMNALLIIIFTLFLKRVLVALASIWDSNSSFGDDHITKQLLPLVVGAGQALMISFGGLFALASLSINIAPLIASLGALTFAVGFAVKDSLSNFVAGILLILDNSFQVGDKIDIPGIGLGYINEISLRTTRILTFDNEIIVVPNNLLMNKEYKNYRMPNDTIRVVVDFSTAYGSKIEHVRESVLEILWEDTDILKDPKPVVEFTSMADFYLAFRAKGYVNSYRNQYDKKLEITEKIYDRLNAEKISIPFPTHKVYLEKET